MACVAAIHVAFAAAGRMIVGGHHSQILANPLRQTVLSLELGLVQRGGVSTVYE